MEIPENIIAIIRSSKSKEEAFTKIKEVKNIPFEVAEFFRNKYDPQRELTARGAFYKLYKEVKG